MTTSKQSSTNPILDSSSYKTIKPVHGNFDNGGTTLQQLARQRNWQKRQLTSMSSILNTMIQGISGDCPMRLEERSKAHNALTEINALLADYSRCNKKLGLKK